MGNCGALWCVETPARPPVDRLVRVKFDQAMVFPFSKKNERPLDLYGARRLEELPLRLLSLLEETGHSAGQEVRISH